MSLSFSLGISEFLIKIWGAAAGQLQYLRRPKPCIEQLKEANDELEAIAADINSSINQAEREGKIPSEQIQLWVSKVTEMKGKIEATEKDFDRMRCLCGSSWNSFSVNRRVAKRMGEINKLKTGVNDIPIAKEPPPPAVVKIPTSNSTLGMEAYMREILDYIACADAGGVIGVYGMGGVGKTTLLRSINNHRNVDVFDYVIWVVASKECKMERLQMHIAKRLKLHLEEDDSDEDRATKLFSFLKNKDCLLLLDDLWKSLDLAMLGMTDATPRQGEQKRKVVVFTTRNGQVCGQMAASKKIEIKCLGPEQARDLFRMNAGEDAIGSDVGIDSIADLIAQECAGLPLALITVGKAMSTKKSYQAWYDALTLMKNSQMPKVTGMKEVDPMFSAFKLSYDSLEDDDMRSRLLSCAMWPEDYQIRKDELIQCWMGLGLINEEGAIHKAYYRGHSYIETLKDACLLEPVDDEEQMVQMHDMIRDMALWMSSDCGMRKYKWIVRAGVTTSEALEEEAWHEAERVSLMHNHNITSLPNQLSTCSKLLVLMLQHNSELKEIRGSLIQAMCALTYLDIEGTGIEEIPTKIGMLSHLRYLNLSDTPIRELPAELGCLVKLNYLLLKSTYILSRVPKGAISNLSSLRLLDLRGSAYENWLDELEGLEGCQKYIGIDISTVATLQRLCSLPYVSIWRLNMKFTYSANLNRLLDIIMRYPKIRQSMEELRIKDGYMKELLIGEGKEEVGGVECLKYLELFNLQRLKEIIWKGVLPQIVFPNLRELHIVGCALRNVNWSMQIPALSVLYIVHCVDMEELISDEDNFSSSSFGLTKLVLLHMRNLKRISQIPLFFPCLEEIMVMNCKFLMKLPFDNHISNKRLKVIRGQQKWWDNLKWEDGSIKDALAPLVHTSLEAPLVWPEDYHIRKGELIQYWMGLDLINEEGPIHEAYDRGHSYIETLRDACLLEPVDYDEHKVQMHDVIRDMALWMSSDCGMRKFKWIVRAGVTTSEALEEEGWHEAERVSLMRNHNVTSLPNQLSTCSKLLVLMLRDCGGLKEIRGSHLQAMCALTYLDLEGTRIEEIPTKIGMLSHLRYLNLSQTPIRKLPAELGCLVKLKYLLLDSTRSLSQVPKGAISNLSSLRLLDLRGSSYVNWLDELEGLEGCKKYISIDISTIATLQRLCSLPYVSIWRLNMGLTDSANLNRLLDDIIRCRKIRKSMEELTIEHARMNELLIGEGKEEAGGLECLKYLRLYNLQWLKEIIWKGVLPQIVFPNLRVLYIFYCRRLRNVNWSMQIPTLSVLRIVSCEGMEELISDEDNSTSSSFGLTKLVLYNNENLKRISQRPLCFPYLEKIEVSDCGYLRKLPFDSLISGRRLKVIRCEQEWWDNLKWENASIKDTLEPLVNTNIIPAFMFCGS